MSTCKTLSFLLCVGSLVIALGGCEREGPMEKTGKELDKASEHVEEALRKEEGVAERAGEKIDEAVKEAGDKLEDATK